MARLVFIGEEFDGRICELAEGATTVGRGDDNQIIIRDATVSARHCQILVHGFEVIVREAGSRNGTWVQGVAVNGQMPVKSGQWIRFGTVEARLELDRPTFEDPKTPETAVAELMDILATKRRAAGKSKPAIPPFTLERRPLGETKDHTSLVSASTQPPLPNPVPPAAPGEAKPAGPPPRRWWRWLSGLFVFALVLPIPT